MTTEAGLEVGIGVVDGRLPLAKESNDCICLEDESMNFLSIGIDFGEGRPTNPVSKEGCGGGEDPSTNPVSKGGGGGGGEEDRFNNP